MQNIMMYIPGFKSGRLWKKIVAALYYLPSLIFLIEDPLLTLFFMSIPFVVFSFIDLFTYQKKGFTKRRAILSFSIAFLVLVSSIFAIPEPTASDNVSEQVAIAESEFENNSLPVTSEINEEKDDTTVESVSYVEPVKPEEEKEPEEIVLSVVEQPKSEPKVVETKAEPKSAPQEVTVYVTRTGAKYHRDGCRYLSKSQIPISLSNAKRSYDPCSVCRPPT